MRKGDPAYGKMSGSGRRRSSKWDLKEESRIPYDIVHDRSWSGKPGLSFHDKESERGWLSPDVAGGNRSKWSVMEPLPGRRGSRRDDSMDEDHNRGLKAMASWEGEESYGTRMSPGLDEWRQQNHHNSPRNEWKRSRRSRSHSPSRSRSRSSDRGFERESGLYDRSRSRSRSGVLSPICKDFAAGRCRRGNHCQFLHQDTHGYEDDWERHRKTANPKYPVPHDSREYPTGSGRSTDCCSDFLKGNCRRGGSCRFPHHGLSHSSGKGSSDDLTRERNNDRRHRDASPERHGNREIRRPADVPCRFFAAGNCRNGKYCRFSHQVQGHASPERSQDRRLLHDQNFDGMEKVWNGPKWNTTSTSAAGKLDGEKNGTVAPDQRGTAWSVDDRWGPCLQADKTLSESSIDNKMVESEKETILWKSENAGNDILGSEQRAGENWLGDMDMSPEWNYKVQPSNHIDKQECTPLTNCDPSITKEASGQVHNGTAALPSLINESSAKPLDYNLKDVSSSALLHDDKSMTGKAAGSHGSFNQSSIISSALPLPGVNIGGQSQVTILTSGGRGIINPQNRALLQEGKTIDKPDFGEGNPSQVNSAAQSMVSSEQLTQLTSISASLAQLFANSQQLPQLLAAHGSHAHNSTESPSFANSEGPVKTDSVVTIQSNETVGKQKQYDPISDSIESGKHDVSNNPPGLSSNLIRQDNITNGKLEMSTKSLLPSSVTGAPNDGDSNKLSGLEEPNDKICLLNDLEPGAISEETKENNGVVTEEGKKSEEDMTAQENDPLENIDVDGKNDEGKKGKDVKGIRAFKFALVEFVKDLLKPTWKGGQMSKDAYKNIVKKVVDKVTGTMQGASIPQTPEKIQQYLSFSKPKLTKLVQAYVEKLQKDK